jgi:hypothetical protein
MQKTSPVPSAAVATPWFRLPIVWMVIAGPSLVVLASFATLALALLYPDPLLPAVAAAADPVGAAQQPAMQARNHVASPRR